MNSAQHRIRSIRWQVGAGSAAEAFSWRSLLREKGAALLLPVLQQGLDEAAPGGRVAHIPKLELSIRLNSLDKLGTILPGRILQQLREQLKFLRAEEGTDGQFNVKEDITVKRTPEHTRFEILMRYLQTGTLSWHVAGDTTSEQAASLNETCRDQLPGILEHLKIAREKAVFYFRLLQLLSEDGCALLVRGLAGAIALESGFAAVQCLALLLDDERERFSRCTRLSLMAAILGESAGRREHSASRSLLKVAAAVVPTQEIHLLEMFIATLPAPLAALFRVEDSGTANGTGSFGCAPGVDVLGLQDSPHQERRPEEAPAARTCHSGAFPEEDEIPIVPAGMVRRTVCEQPAADLFPMLVQQAGLVLLHPYLARFFENCGLKWVGSAELPLSALPRAAALLHFLATGREELYEYELGLIKILLGRHPESPLPVCEGLLTANDIEEAEALLQSAIGHWSALKNTSIQGVRSSFIERHGLMREEGGSWRLNVERGPYDMLLDRIPWGISIVKLPWMQKAIFTEW